MSAIETWRVIFADGAVCFVAVERTGGGFRASRPNLSPSEWGTAHGAIMRLDGVRGWDVAEILSPGQESRAEVRESIVANLREWARQSRHRIGNYADALNVAADEIAAGRTP